MLALAFFSKFSYNKRCKGVIENSIARLAKEATRYQVKVSSNSETTIFATVREYSLKVNHRILRTPFLNDQD